MTDAVSLASTHQRISLPARRRRNSAQIDAHLLWARSLRGTRQVDWQFVQGSHVVAAQDSAAAP
ncbi:MAG: hypothetical protein N2483_05945 [Burkholderiaceae bacterium]|nr:hypothetical protein [Burkholderiaceae bacterium]